MSSLGTAIIDIVVILFSVILHEVAHGVAARQYGDHTAEREGRLTLNPIPHIDLYGTIILPLLIVILNMGGANLPVLGWAKPVPVRPGSMRHPRHDWMMVSLAGPATNLALVVLAALPLRLGLVPPDLVTLILIRVIVVNVSLAVFNLLPLPPLDGSRVVMRFLPPRALEAYLRMEGSAGIIVLYVLLALGIVSRVIGPIVQFLVTRALGIG